MPQGTRPQRGQRSSHGDTLRTLGDHIDLAQAHVVEEIGQRRSGGGDHRLGGWRGVGFAGAGQVRRVNRAVATQCRQKIGEAATCPFAAVDAQQRRQFVESATGRDGVMDVQLAPAALEVGAAQPGRRTGGSAQNISDAPGAWRGAGACRGLMFGPVIIWS
jgi:hypothetical protein